jgi:hypothetical protein
MFVLILDRNVLSPCSGTINLVEIDERNEVTLKKEVASSSETPE